MTGEPARLSPEAASALLVLARDSILTAFAGEPIPRPTASDPALDEPSGAFVTLRSRRGMLRGCIGRVESDRPLWETVAGMARASAFDDPRFPALDEAELGDVTIEVSVMSPPWRIDNPEDVVPGRHGVMVERGLRRGLFLPQVATEQGWGREVLLDQVCLKAGLPPSAWREPETAIYVFTATVIGE